MSNFKREVRYTVIKHSQLTESQMQYLKGCIFGEGIPTVEAVVVEADWPEYQPVWQMIEDRVTGAPVEGGKAEYDAMAAAMTTNQTIDGVPRELLESFAAYVSDSPNAIMRARVKELRALLDAPVECRCKRYGKGNPHWPCPVHAAPAAQPQGEPVAWRVTGHGGLTVTPEYPRWATGKGSEGLKVEALVVAEQPATVKDI